MSAPSKLDQIRALRERRFAERVPAPVSQPVINETIQKPAVINIASGSTSAQRQAKWRKANPEINRQRAREGMRKLRDKAVEHADAGP